MASARDSELTLINWLITAPSIYKENENNLKQFPFEYPYSKDIYSIVVSTIKKHGTAPTLIEAKSLAEKLSDKRNHTSIQRSKLQDDLDYAYRTASTASSGDVFYNYIFQQGARELANKLLVSTPDDFKRHYSELKDKLDSLSQVEEKEESLGVSLMSKQDITSCMELIESANTQECIATGFRAWDRHLLGGFRPGEVAMVMAATGQGKALTMSSLVLTPTGFVKMADVKVGMDICNTQGGVSQITAIWPQGVKDIYEMTFKDQTKVRCCEDHLWSVTTSQHVYKGKDFHVLPLKDFKDKITNKQGKSEYRIPMPESVYFGEQPVPLDPYLLGLLLGDGSFRGRSIRYSTSDIDLLPYISSKLPDGIVCKYISRYDYCLVKKVSKGVPLRNDLREIIRGLGLESLKSADKFIPDIYKYNTTEVRLAVLQGLVDTDGHIGAHSGVDYVCASERLVDDITFIVRSLGGLVGPKKHKVVNGVRYPRISIKMPPNVLPCRLPRRIEKYVEPTKYPTVKIIRSIEPVGQEECQCITTNSPDSCFITDDFIVTHNTAFLLNIAHNNAVDMGKRVVYITMDNQVEECAERFFANWLKQPINNVKKYSSMQEELLNKVKEGSEHNLIMQAWLPQSYSPQDIIKYINKLKDKLKIYDYEHGVAIDKCGHIDLIMVDYLEKMIPSNKQELYRQALFQIADECVIVAKTFGCPLILASQASKEAMKAETSQIHMSAESYAKLHPCAHVMILSMSDDERLAVPSRFKVINGKNRRPETSYAVPMIFDRYSQTIIEDPDRPIIALNSTLRTDASASQHSVDRAQAQAGNAFEVAQMFNESQNRRHGIGVEVSGVSADS